MKTNEYKNYFIQYYEQPVEIALGFTFSELLLLMGVTSIIILPTILIGLVVKWLVQVGFILCVIVDIILYSYLMFNRKNRNLLPKGYLYHFFYIFPFFTIKKIRKKDRIYR